MQLLVNFIRLYANLMNACILGEVHLNLPGHYLWCTINIVATFTRQLQNVMWINIILYSQA